MCDLGIPLGGGVETRAFGKTEKVLQFSKIDICAGEKSSKRKQIAGIVLILSMVLTMACAQKAAPAPAPQAPAAPAVATSAKAAWEIENQNQKERRQ